jgi:hypothetical protein
LSHPISAPFTSVAAETIHPGLTGRDAMKRLIVEAREG